MSGSRGIGSPSQEQSESVQRTVHPATEMVCRMLGRTSTCDWTVASPIVPVPIAWWRSKNRIESGWCHRNGCVQMSAQKYFGALGVRAITRMYVCTCVQTRRRRICVLLCYLIGSSKTRSTHDQSITHSSRYGAHRGFGREEASDSATSTL